MSEKILHYTDKDMSQENLNAHNLMLVDFWAPWCGPCRMVAPVLEQLSEELDGKMEIAKVNIDENQEAASKLGIMSIPTMVIFKNGQEVDRIVGALPKPRLMQTISKHL